MHAHILIQHKQHPADALGSSWYQTMTADSCLKVHRPHLAVPLWNQVSQLALKYDVAQDRDSGNASAQRWKAGVGDQGGDAGVQELAQEDGMSKQELLLAVRVMPAVQCRRDHTPWDVAAADHSQHCLLSAHPLPPCSCATSCQMLHAFAECHH